MMYQQWEEETESYLFGNGGGNCSEAVKERERERIFVFRLLGLDFKSTLKYNWSTCCIRDLEIWKVIAYRKGNTVVNDLAFRSVLTNWRRSKKKVIPFFFFFLGSKLREQLYIIQYLQQLEDGITLHHLLFAQITNELLSTLSKSNTFTY